MAILDRLKKREEADKEASAKVLDTKKEAKKAAKKEGKKEGKKETKKEVSTKKTSSPKKGPYKHAGLLIRPAVTEKSTLMAEQGKYVFIVDTSANKIQIKMAIREVYGVQPTNVHTVKQNGKTVRWGRMKGKRSDYKKAYVTLKKGDKIDFAV